jgi:hypothetical protein
MLFYYVPHNLIFINLRESPFNAQFDPEPLFET